MFSKVKWILIIVVFLATVVAVADYCVPRCILWGPDGECVQYQGEDCYPEYYTVMTEEPDWCLYEAGDKVFLRWQGSTITGWYVVVCNEQNPPPSDFDPNTWWVEGNCTISPWAYCSGPLDPSKIRPL